MVPLADLRKKKLQKTSFKKELQRILRLQQLDEDEIPEKELQKKASELQPEKELHLVRWPKKSFKKELQWGCQNDPPVPVSLRNCILARPPISKISQQ